MANHAGLHNSSHHTQPDPLIANDYFNTKLLVPIVTLFKTFLLSVAKKFKNGNLNTSFGLDSRLVCAWFVARDWLRHVVGSWKGKIKRVTYHIIQYFAYDWSPCCKYSTLDSFPSYLFLGICRRISLTFGVICRSPFVRVGGIDHGHKSHAQIHSEKVHNTKTWTGQSC